MKTDTSVIAEKYKDRVFSAAFSICGNPADAEDIVQETFLQYHMTSTDFSGEQHIRAWLIRVAVNKAKNLNMSFWHRKSIPLEDYEETLSFETPESKGLFEEVMKLPEKYRIVLHLYYFEDYSVREIAGILHVTESNVKVRLNRSRKMLKKALKEGWENE